MASLTFKTSSNISNNNFLEHFLPDKTLLSKPFYDSFKRSTTISINEFNNCPIINNDFELRILSLNARSLNKCFLDLQLFLDSSKITFNVIAITETWLDENNENLFPMTNYSLFKANRNSKRGGGIAIYIETKTLTFERYDLAYQSDIAEILAIEIVTKTTKNIVLFNIYRPPSSNPYTFLDTLENILQKVTSENKIIYCLGDFNININDDSIIATNFLTLMSSFFLYPTNSAPTRTTSTTSTNIDLIFTNNFTCFNGGVIETDFSDHHSVFLMQNFSLKNSKQSNNQYIKFQNISAKNLKIFKQYLHNYDWSLVFNLKECDAAFQHFINQISEVFIKCCPFTYKKQKHFKPSNPWFTTSLKKLISKKNILFNIYKKSHNIIDLNNYKMFRNRLNKIILSAKRKYYQSLFQNTKNDAKETWKHVNNIISSKIKLPKTTILQVNDKVIDDPFEISKIFNDHFINSFSSFGLSNTNVLKYVPIKPLENFSSHLTTPQEIISIAKKLSNSASKDFHNFSNVIVKYIIDPIAVVLTYIMNLSLEQGTFPSVFKITKVYPIHKSESTLDPKNYRPISIISVFSKILEKIMYIRINAFLNSNNILNNQQFGFRKGYSTEAALLQIFNDIYNNYNNNCYSMAVFIDYTKAFDNINHQILLKKLQIYGISGVEHRWFSSYLSNRQQYVSIDSTYSSPKFICGGVPQGSILGPLLFNIYINDIVHSSPSTKFVMYADDATIYQHSHDIPLLFINMNQALNEIHDWSLSNGLTIILKKTKFMIFNQKTNTNNSFLKINNFELEMVNVFKLLGILVDNRLNFNNHIDHLTKKISRNLGVINRIKFYVTISTLFSLYYSLFFSYIYYCNLIWGATYKTHLNKLYILQKRFFYIIKQFLNITYTLDITTYFNKYNILSIFELNIYKSCLYFFNLIHYNNT